MDANQDKRLAKLILDWGLMTFDQIRACVEESKGQTGLSQDLDRVIVNKGYLPSHTMSYLVAKVKDEELACPDCQSHYSGGAFHQIDEFVCPKCDQKLVANNTHSQSLSQSETIAASDDDFESHPTLMSQHQTGSPGADGDESPQEVTSDQLEAAMTGDQSTPEVTGTGQGRGDSEGEAHQIGDQLGGDVELLDMLGKGGMGAVFLGHQKSLNRKVAVKVISPDVTVSEDFLARFEREAQMAAQVNHPNIVQVYAIGEDRGQKYIIMEYVEGTSLKEILNSQGSLTISHAIEAMIQASRGLGAAHQKGILHRDIKPDNLFVDPHGHVKIGDFGIAKNPDEATLTQAGAIMGTPHYMSPEQAQGNEVDHRSDIYSLGATFYHALVGQTPFQGETPITVLYQHIQDTVSFPVEFKNSLPSSVQKIVLKMMDKKPKKRYQKMEEVVEDLEKALEDLSTSENTKKISSLFKKVLGGKSEKPASASGRADKTIDPSKPQVTLGGMSVKKTSSAALILGGVCCVIMVGLLGWIGWVIFHENPQVAKKGDSVEKKKEGKKEKDSPSQKGDNPSTGPTETDQAPLSVYEKINELVEKNDFAGALALVKENREKFPQDSSLETKKEWVLAKKREYDQKYAEVKGLINSAKESEKKGKIKKAIQFYLLLTQKGGDLNSVRKVRELSLKVARQAYENKKYAEAAQYLSLAGQHEGEDLELLGKLRKKVEDLYKKAEAARDVKDLSKSAQLYGQLLGFYRYLSARLPESLEGKVKTLFISLASLSFAKNKTSLLARLLEKTSHVGDGPAWISQWVGQAKEELLKEEGAFRSAFAPRLQEYKDKPQKLVNTKVELYEKLDGFYREKQTEVSVLLQRISSRNQSLRTKVYQLNNFLEKKREKLKKWKDSL